MVAIHHSEPRYVGKAEHAVRRITLCMAYYRNAGMLAEQFKRLRALPQDIKDQICVIIVDDGSPDGAARGEPLGLPVGVYRIGVDVRTGPRYVGQCRMSEPRARCGRTCGYQARSSHSVPGRPCAKPRSRSTCTSRSTLGSSAFR